MADKVYRTVSYEPHHATFKTGSQSFSAPEQAVEELIDNSIQATIGNDGRQALHPPRAATDHPPRGAAPTPLLSNPTPSHPLCAHSA